MPVTPPMLKGTVSSGSYTASCVVGTLTVKLDTPAGTLIVPSALSVTPLLNTGAPKSSALAVPPPSVNAYRAVAVVAAPRVTV